MHDVHIDVAYGYTELHDAYNNDADNFVTKTAVVQTPILGLHVLCTILATLLYEIDQMQQHRYRYR